MNHLVGVVHDVAGRGEPGPQRGDVHVDRQPAVDGAVGGRQPLEELPPDVEGLRPPLVNA